MTPPILVLGGTGTQGGAVVTSLLARGDAVRALVRDPDAPAARALAAQGATLATGRLDDAGSLEGAMEGASGVFCVLPVGGEDDPGLELRAGRAVIAACRASGITMLVHSSVARAGEHESFAGWREGRWWVRYWQDKAEMNQAVRESGLAHWCILKPAFLMDNFLPPKMAFMAPHLAQGELLTAMATNTRLDMIAAEDVAAFAASALATPHRFAGAEIALAAGSYTMAEVAGWLAQATGMPVRAVHRPADQAEAAGLLRMVIDGQLWDDMEGYQVDIAGLAKWGVQLTPFAAWAMRHRDAFRIGRGKIDVNG